MDHASQSASPCHVPSWVLMFSFFTSWFFTFLFACLLPPLTLLSSFVRPTTIYILQSLSPMTTLFNLILDLALLESAVNALMWAFFTITNSTFIYQLWFSIHPEKVGQISRSPRTPETQMALEWLNSYVWFASIPQGMLMYFWRTQSFQCQYAVMLSILWALWWVVWFQGMFKYKIWKSWALFIFVPFRAFELFASTYVAISCCIWVILKVLNRSMQVEVWLRWLHIFDPNYPQNQRPCSGS